jgi:phosphonate transport system ATP-binding protein
VLYQAPEVLLADEPVSAMDPVLAQHTLSVLCRHAREQNVTLVASLHAVELALAHFSRIIGLRDGQILFDLAASAVDRELLDKLYANEQLQSSPIPSAPLSVQIPRC